MDWYIINRLKSLEKPQYSSIIIFIIQHCYKSDAQDLNKREKTISAFSISHCSITASLKAINW